MTFFDATKSSLDEKILLTSIPAWSTQPAALVFRLLVQISAVPTENLLVLK